MTTNIKRTDVTIQSLKDLGYEPMFHHKDGSTLPVMPYDAEQIMQNFVDDCKAGCAIRFKNENGLRLAMSDYMGRDIPVGADDWEVVIARKYEEE